MPDPETDPIGAYWIDGTGNGTEANADNVSAREDVLADYASDVAELAVTVDDTPSAELLQLRNYFAAKYVLGSPIVAPTAAYNDVVDADSPVIHYKCADTFGTTLTARIGPNATLDSTYTLAVTGLVANNGGDTAIQFDRPSGTIGGRAEVTQASAEAILDTAAYTYEVWLSPLSDTARSSAQNILDRTFYGLYLSADNKPGIFYGSGGASAANATNALLAGTTYHLVYTYDGTTHKVYVNASAVITQTGTISAGGPLGIGRYPGAGDTLNAVVDEIAIYPTALSAARVTAHHNAGI